LGRNVAAASGALEMIATRFVVAAALLGAASLSAYAETWVSGFGEKIQEAADNAISAAERGANSKGTCLSHLPDLSRCDKQTKGGSQIWECKAAFSNHKGSCAKKSDWDKFKEARKALGI
jgi:predicted small secreted protein